MMFNIYMRVHTNACVDRYLYTVGLFCILRWVQSRQHATDVSQGGERGEIRVSDRTSVVLVCYCERTINEHKRWNSSQSQYTRLVNA